MSKRKRIFHWLVGIIGVAFFLAFSAGAVLAQNVTQGYESDTPLQKGMMVRLKPGDGSKVQAVTQTDAPSMLGVVVSASDAPVTLSNTGAKQQVFVATYGQYDVLISNQNGAVKVGDLITVSSLSGIGMRADNKQEIIIGKALTAFDGKTGSIGTASLDTSKGKKSVNLGIVNVAVSVAHNPLYDKDNTPGVPKFLSKAAQIVTDRPVSAFRIYASLAVLVVCFAIAGAILYIGVRSSMTAVGRNPLAKKSIMRSLVQVVLISLIIFVISVIAVYLLLKI